MIINNQLCIRKQKFILAYTRYIDPLNKTSDSLCVFIALGVKYCSSLAKKIDYGNCYFVLNAYKGK